MTEEVIISETVGVDGEPVDPDEGERVPDPEDEADG